MGRDKVPLPFFYIYYSLRTSSSHSGTRSRVIHFLSAVSLPRPHPLLSSYHFIICHTYQNPYRYAPSNINPCQSHRQSNSVDNEILQVPIKLHLDLHRAEGESTNTKYDSLDAICRCQVNTIA